MPEALLPADLDFKTFASWLGYGLEWSSHGGMWSQVTSDCEQRIDSIFLARARAIVWLCVRQVFLHPDCPWTYCIEDDYELQSLLPSPPSARIIGVCHQTCLMWCWDQMQGIVHASQALYQLSYTYCQILDF